MKCIICGEEGEVSQCPYPIAYSSCYCDLCYRLEEIAYRVWRDEYPQALREGIPAPLPFIKSKEEMPENIEDYTSEEVKEFFRKKLKTLKN